MPPFRLYLISDETTYPGMLGKWLLRFSPMVPVGIQFREKFKSPREQWQALEPLISLALGRTSIFFYLNDRADLAVSLGLHGVHLREDSLPTNQLHPWFKQNLSVAVSTHSIEGILRAEQAGADFVTLGPIFETPSKSQYGSPLGLEILRKAAQCTHIPIFALGGITLDRVHVCMEAGAYGISMISAVWNASRPGEALTHFHRQVVQSQLQLQNRLSPQW